MFKQVLSIELRAIGIVRVELSDEEVKNSIDGVDGSIEVYPEYSDGLKEIDGFSHLIVIAYLHKVRSEDRAVLLVKHRKWARFGVTIDDLPEVGVFASNSPARPNPIALSIVKLVKREERVLHVRGLDLFNGTPVLDIKPYTPDRCISDIELPLWYRELLNRVEKAIGRRLASP